jgi:hypothetical protein
MCVRARRQAESVSRDNNGENTVQAIRRNKPAYSACFAGVLLLVSMQAFAHQCSDSTGQRVNIGELACLTINGKSHMARCEKSGDDMIWRRVGDGCPVT